MFLSFTHTHSCCFFFINVPEIIWNFIQNNIKYKKKFFKCHLKSLPSSVFLCTKEVESTSKHYFYMNPSRRGCGLKKWNALLWSLDFNSFLLTKPSSKLSRKRKRKEDKQEAKMKMDWRVLFLWNFVYLWGERCWQVCGAALCLS